MTVAETLTHLVDGTLVAYDVGGLMKAVLIAGPDAASLAGPLVDDGAQPVVQGELTLRLGVALYDRPFLFVPHSIIDESGATFQGEVVFDWLRVRAYDMPRSEVFGLNARGREDQVFARDIDVESSPIVVGGAETSPVYVAAWTGELVIPQRFTAAMNSVATPDAAAIRRLVESA